MTSLLAESKPELAALPEPARGQLLLLQGQAQRAQYLANHPDAIESVILADGEPAGRCWTARSADADHLLDIIVIDRLRGQGIGTTVLRRFCAEAGDRPVRLHVWAQNHGAIRLYQRLGFEVDGAGNGYLAMSTRGRHREAGR